MMLFNDMWPICTIFSLVVCINIIVQDMWPVQWAFASMATFQHVLVFNCYYSCLFYVVLENKIWWWWWWWYLTLAFLVVFTFMHQKYAVTCCIAVFSVYCANRLSHFILIVIWSGTHCFSESGTRPALPVILFFSNIPNLTLFVVVIGAQSLLLSWRGLLKRFKQTREKTKNARKIFSRWKCLSAGM